MKRVRSVVIYSRASTDEQETSCEAQVEFMKRFCVERGLEIVHIYPPERLSLIHI